MSAPSSEAATPSAARVSTWMIADTLVPEFDSPLRRSSLVPATFNLTATIIGGGVLSLPLAFMKCGIILGTLLMIVAGIVTERSLYLLCLTARLTGAQSYGEVGKAAFGKYMEYFISLLLFVFLLFVLTAYMVLVQDIWTSLLQSLSLLHNNSKRTSEMVLLFIVVLLSPFLFQRTLHALRFNCYIGFASISCLCFALCHNAVVSITMMTTTTATGVADRETYFMWPASLGDVLFAFPIITLSFLSIFNVLPIQSALVQPTRRRMLTVIDGAMGSSFVIMLLFGIAGYIYAGAETDGNILNNCDNNGDHNNSISNTDWIFFLGRLGSGVTIMLAMPMMLLPCRESLLEVLEVCVHGEHHIALEAQEEVIESLSGEETPLLMMKQHRATVLNAKPPASTTLSLMDNSVAHNLATIGITVTCYLAAIRVPGVAIVWSLCGSFMAFLIAFILPAACYLKIQKDHPVAMQIHGDGERNQGWSKFSWILLVASIAAAIACTIQTVIGLI